jgi:hypothetical protein
MTWEVQLLLEASGMVWPPLRIYMSWVEHIKQLPVGAFMSSLGVKGPTKSWEAQEHDQKFVEI